MSTHSAVYVPQSLAKRLLEDELIRFSWEHRHALWFGIPMTFSDGQRACWKVLWDNFFRGNLPVPNERLFSGYYGKTTHIYHLFKRHDAWLKEIIVGDGRGGFWLRVPPELPPGPAVTIEPPTAR